MAVPAVLRLLTVGALTLTAASLVSGTPCPPEWRQSGAWCYLTNTSSSLSWAGAADLCQERGGSLVTLENRSKLLDVVDLLKALRTSQRWWIGIQKTSGSTSLAERDENVLDNFGEEKIIKNASSSHICVYMTAADGLWYWTACDSTLNYICQKQAARVQVVVVSPEHSRPQLSWLQAHEAALAEGLLREDPADDKGEYSASKATMTPIPPSTTTPLPPATSAPAASTGTTPSPCSGHNWWLLSSRCHHLFIDAKSFDEAEQFCQAKGGHLTRFESQSEQTTFMERYHFNSGSVWIGLSRSSGSADFRWNSGAAPSFSTWAPGEPATNRTCACLDLATKYWRTADCAERKSFSCCRSPDATERPPTAPTTTTTPAPAACGGGDWWQFGSSCLLLVSNTPASWHAAEQDCRNRSATQVKVTSSQLNENIRTKLNGVSAWIGLSKLNKAGTFQWTDGSPLGDGYAIWSHSRETSLGIASCAEMHGSHGYWRRANCNAPLPYVCQRPADGSRPPLPPPTGPPPRSSCPAPWRQFGPDRCLRLFNQTLSWETARQWCRDQADGGDLVSVPSAVHQAFLTSAMKDINANMWISLTYDELDRKRFLTWMDESPVNYTNWAPGQPSVPCVGCPRTCGVVDGRSTASAASWAATDCTTSYGAVCQRPATPNNSIAVNQIYCNDTDSYIAAGSACYKVAHGAMTWHDAADACRNEGGALAYVGDVFDNAELVKLLYQDGSDQYWLGLSDTARHGMMEWIKPWPAEMTFTNWDPSHPREPSRDSCAVIVASSGLWQHRDCSLQRRPFVCQIAPEREATQPAEGHCPAGRGWSGGDTRCFRAFEPTGAGLTWDQAKAACEEHGYELATVSTVDDFRAVREAVGALSVRIAAWIGLRSQQDKEYRWTDGRPVSYRAWQRSEPVQPAACVQASRLNNGRWKTMECSQQTAYVCMMAMSGSITDAISSEASGGSGWAAFGVVLLVMALLVSVAGLGLWYARRRRLRWLPVWLQGPRGAHHSVENLAYSRHKNDGAEGAMDNMDAIATNRWGSQEHLVIQDDS